MNLLTSQSTEIDVSRSLRAVNFLKVVPIAPGASATYLAYQTPSDKKFFSAIAGWKHYSGQGDQDLLIQYNVGTRIIIESAKNDTAKTWPPFNEVLRRDIVNTSDSAVGRDYNRASTNAASAIIDNWFLTANASAVAIGFDECRFFIQNQSLHYTHYVGLFMSGTEYDAKDDIRGYPIQYQSPSESWKQREVNLGSERFNLAASGTKVFGPIPTLGQTFMKFLAFAEDQNVSVAIAQGIDDRAAVLAYRDTATYNVPSGTTVGDEIEIFGKYIRITVTNLSGAAATDVEFNAQIRPVY